MENTYEGHNFKIQAHYILKHHQNLLRFPRSLLTFHLKSLARNITAEDQGCETPLYML